MPCILFMGYIIGSVIIRLGASESQTTINESMTTNFLHKPLKVKPEPEG
jgi:hypothetical protein